MAIAAASALGYADVSNSAPLKPVDLLGHLHGQKNAKGQLVLDEARGSFAGLHLGMPFSAVKKAMPEANFFVSEGNGGELFYCSHPAGHNCEGAVNVQISGGCTLGFDTSTACFLTTAPGPVAEIDLVAVSNPAASSEDRAAATTRGIRLGSSGTDVTRTYEIVSRANASCGNAAFAEPGTSYVALTGRNTLVFTVYHGSVWAISLISGRHPHLCPH